ncbi:glycosyltransferase family 9 protein [Fundidesulfovibrio putealis]|uniref:glycosyltransferase family 9 protein n=1 Tax=Fundidesulfovibrio putealis TaxID=270496 RepID=UPI00041C671E|nr:glycosyltransferase family 9 protein [Fundidesulfovibrio putealis]
MRTLVINLTRFGDLLQTQPVFTGLKESGDTVGLVCLQNFLPATALVRDLDAVFAIPGARLLAELDRSWPVALGSCLGFVDNVRGEFAPDRVINLTSSLPSRLLARAMRADVVQGFGLDDFGYGIYSTPWAAFLEATALHRGSSPFNLVDLFFKAAHLGDAPRRFRLAEPDPSALSDVRALISEQAIGNATDIAGYVGLQLGASAAKRQWPTQHFAQVAQRLWERHRLLPVLLGGKDEQELAGRFAASTGVPHVNLVGRTGLPQLAAAVSLLRVLVTNDTGTMHLAAGLGVPILAIFLATAQPWDTGPYLPGACCLEPDLPCHPCSFSHECPIDWACRNAVRPETVAACLDGWLESGRWPDVAGRGVRAWECYSDAGGFLGLRSLSGHDGADRTVWNEIQRQAWRRFLDGQPQSFRGDEAERLSPAFREHLAGVLLQAGGLLDVLIQQSRLLAMAPRPALRSKFMATWQRLESLFASDPAFSTLGHLWLHLSQAESPDMSRFDSFALSVADMVSALSGLFVPRP